MKDARTQILLPFARPCPRWYGLPASAKLQSYPDRCVCVWRRSAPRRRRCVGARRRRWKRKCSGDSRTCYCAPCPAAKKKSAHLSSRFRFVRFPFGSFRWVVRVCFDAQKRAWMFRECTLFLLKFHQTVEGCLFLFLFFFDQAVSFSLRTN